MLSLEKNKMMLGAVRRHFTHHAAAYVLAILAGIIIGAPVVFSMWSLGTSYKGVPFLYQDSEYRYLARIHDVLDGHPSLGSPVTFEYKDVPTAFAPMGEYIYAGLSTITFLSLNHFVVVSKFVFPAILFVLVYFFVFVLSRDREIKNARLTALCAASLVLFGYDFVDPHRLVSLWHNLGPVFYISVWTRLVNPITGALLLFGFCLSLWAMMRAKRYAWVYGGVMLGLMTGYIFSFALAATSALVLIIFLVFQKKYAVVRSVVYSVCVGVVINLFQFSQFIRSLRSASGQEFALRGGLILTHVPLVSHLLLAVSLVWILVIVVPRLRHSTPASDTETLIHSLVIGVFVVMNQQVITGRTVWPQHFVQYAIPLSIIMLVILGATIAAWCARRTHRFVHVWMWVATLVVCGCFLFGIRTMFSYKMVAADFADRQRSAETFTWLDSHAAKDCVVFAVETEDRLADMIPALTHCNVYNTSYTFAGMPHERIVHNYFSWLRFVGVSAAQSDAYFATHIPEFQALLFTDWKELFRPSTDPWLTKASDRPAIDAKYRTLAVVLAAEYRQFLSLNFYTQLKQYRLDYVVWDRERFPTWNAAAFPFLSKVFEGSGIVVYSVANPVR